MIFQKIKTFFVYLWDLIQKSGFPVWLSVVSAVAGGTVTYCAVPALNQQLEYQKIRAAYITKILDEVNISTSEYVGLVTQIKNLSDGEKIPSDLLGAEARAATRLLWRANELSIVLSTDADAKIIHEYQRALIDLKKIAELPPTSDDNPLELKVGEFMQASFVLGNRLADLAKLRNSFD